MYFINFELGLFINSPIQKSPEDFCSTLKNQLNEESRVFDVTPLIFPLPNQAYVLQLTSSDKKYVVKIAPDRADIWYHIQNDDTDKNYSDNKKNFNKMFQKFFHAISSEVTIYRMAHIASYIEIMNDVISKMENFFRKDFFQPSPKDIKIEYNVGGEVHDLKIGINNITKLQKAYNEKNEMGLYIQRDINTSKEERTRDFKADDYERFSNFTEVFFNFEAINKVMI